MAAKRGSSPSQANSRISRRGESISGWLFCSPVIIILGVFLFIPIVMALWVSFSNWSGRGDPFSAGVGFVGFANYETVLTKPGLAQSDFGMAIKNNAWYTLLVIPLQTLLSLLLAVLVNRRALKARGFFRTAFYFPSVTSSVAITVLWMFLFNTSGSVNAVLSWFGVHGPNWFNDPDGIVHLLLAKLGVTQGPQPLASHGLLGVSWWDWLGGPSVAMFAIILMVIFTTSGTFMLMFVAALQSIGESTEEAAIMDGASSWQRLWKVTIPQLKPTIFTVITLGIIGTWQVFDQIYTGTKGGPAKTTLTPAYLSYSAAFNNQEWGQGAAISFVLFIIIVAMTAIQRRLMKERGLSRRKRARYEQMKREARAMSAAATGGSGIAGSGAAVPTNPATAAGPVASKEVV
ncbi:MAG: sugar ABC transporter permease [Bifidobacterium sp.]|nr:sugar ABC transporter permease [Bifidobacterium sp.]